MIVHLERQHAHVLSGPVLRGSMLSRTPLGRNSLGRHPLGRPALSGGVGGRCAAGGLDLDGDGRVAWHLDVQQAGAVRADAGAQEGGAAFERLGGGYLGQRHGTADRRDLLRGQLARPRQEDRPGRRARLVLRQARPAYLGAEFGRGRPGVCLRAAQQGRQGAATAGRGLLPRDGVDQTAEPGQRAFLSVARRPVRARAPGRGRRGVAAALDVGGEGADRLRQPRPRGRVLLRPPLA